METVKILEAIRELPFLEKLKLLELIFQEIKAEATQPQGGEEQQRRKAAESLLADYEKDEELTVFTVLDKEDFYEPR